MLGVCLKAGFDAIESDNLIGGQGASGAGSICRFKGGGFGMP